MSMFGKVFEFFKGDASLEVDKSGAPTADDLQIATGVLLLQMAGSDDDYAPEEVHAVFRTMEKEFHISQDRALELLELADAARQAKGRIDEFVEAINEHFDEKQKQRVLAMVWRVVMADAKVDAFESRYAKQLKSRLHLSDELAEEARQMALADPVD